MSARNTGIAHHMWRIGIAQNTRNGIGRQSYECALAWYVWLIIVGKQFYIALGGGNNNAHIAAIEVYIGLLCRLFHRQHHEHFKPRERQTHISHIAIEALFHGVIVEERRHKALFKLPFALVGLQFVVSFQHGSDIIVASPAQRRGYVVCNAMRHLI